MPQVSQIELKQGNIVDPTFGLQALAHESERKTKENRQMEAVANTLRKQLELKKLSKGTTVTVNQGGGIEWTGENAAKDEANFNNWGANDYGKKGTGNSVTSKQITNRAGDARNRATSYVNADKGKFDAVAAEAARLSLNGKEPLDVKLPKINGVPPPGADIMAEHEAAVKQGELQKASGSANLVIPEGATATTTPAKTTTPDGTTHSETVSAGESRTRGASVDLPSYNENGSELNLEQSVVDTEVTDYLKLDQTDLAVAQAMQDIYAQINGGASPKSYSGLMKMNEDTIAASRAAKLASGTTEKEVAGTNFGVAVNGGRTSWNASDSKEARQVIQDGGRGADRKAEEEDHVINSSQDINAYVRVVGGTLKDLSPTNTVEVGFADAGAKTNTQATFKKDQIDRATRGEARGMGAYVVEETNAAGKPEMHYYRKATYNADGTVKNKGQLWGIANLNVSNIRASLGGTLGSYMSYNSKGEPIYYGQAINGITIVGEVENGLVRIFTGNEARRNKDQK